MTEEGRRERKREKVRERELRTLVSVLSVIREIDQSLEELYLPVVCGFYTTQGQTNIWTDVDCDPKCCVGNKRVIKAENI